MQRQQMPPRIHFAAISGPIKHFIELDYKYQPEKRLAFLNSRFTFQLGTQVIDTQSCLTWP